MDDVDERAALHVVAVHLGWTEDEAERYLTIPGPGQLSFTLAGLVQLVTTQADEVRKWQRIIGQANEHLARLDKVERRVARLESECPGHTEGGKPSAAD